MVRARRGTYAFIAASVLLARALAVLSMGFVLGNLEVLARPLRRLPSDLHHHERMFLASSTAQR